MPSLLLSKLVCLCSSQLFDNRDSTPNTYDAILKFENQQCCDRFFQELDGKPYNTMEPELIRIEFVKEVHFSKAGQQLFPSPSEPCHCPVCLGELKAMPPSICLSLPGSLIDIAERIESEDNGVLTTICNHMMHFACVARATKWDSDGSCPVCRYCVRPSDDALCSVCSASQSLWICLICGNVNCGRFVQGHAEQHFQQTQHTFALELETQRVWDYAGDK